MKASFQRWHKDFSNEDSRQRIGKQRNKDKPVSNKYEGQ